MSRASWLWPDVPLTFAILALVFPLWRIATDLDSIAASLAVMASPAAASAPRGTP